MTRPTREPTDTEARRIMRERDDRAMILNPTLWPRWPALPLKKRTHDGVGFPPYAVLLWGDLNNDPDETTPLTVFKDCSIFQKIPEDAERIEYDNVDALLADGWVVD